MAAAKVGLPQIEAEKFFNYYESNGWRVGRVKMVSFQHALAGWKIRWQERQHGVNPPSQHWAEGQLRRMNEQIRKEDQG